MIRTATVTRVALVIVSPALDLTSGRRHRPGMLLPQPLAHGRLVARYKRFFADVILDDGRAVTAHCPNPGAMLGLSTPGLGAWLSPAEGAKRKLPWTLALVEADGALVGVNTLHPNRLAADALANAALGE